MSFQNYSRRGCSRQDRQYNNCASGISKVHSVNSQRKRAPSDLLYLNRSNHDKASSRPHSRAMTIAHVQPRIQELSGHETIPIIDIQSTRTTQASPKIMPSHENRPLEAPFPKSPSVMPNLSLASEHGHRYCEPFVEAEASTLSQEMDPIQVVRSPPLYELDQQTAFDPRMAEAMFWREFKQIFKQRHGILSLRHQIHQMRRDLRDEQNLKAVAEDKLFQRILRQELDVHPTDQTTYRDEVRYLIQQFHKVRAEYYPLEYECTNLESKLNTDEFILQQSEDEFYSRWNVVPNFRPEFAQTFQFRNGAPIIPDKNYEDEQPKKYDPLVDEFLFRLGQLDILHEQLVDFDERLEEVEGLLERRRKYGTGVDPAEEEWYQNKDVNLVHHHEKIKQAEKDLQDVRQQCLAQGLIDDHDNPLDTAAQQPYSIPIHIPEPELGPNATPSRISELPVHLPYSENVQTTTNFPEAAYPAAKCDIPKDLTSLSDLPASEPDFNPIDRVELWILMVLNCSYLEKAQLARYHNRTTIDDLWPEVLEIWVKDGYARSVPTSGPQTSSLSSAETTGDESSTSDREVKDESWIESVIDGDVDANCAAYQK